MIVIRFGKWNSKATSMFTYDRVYRNGCEWTPLCIKKFRYVNSQPTIDIDTVIKDIHNLQDGLCTMEEKHNALLDGVGEIYNRLRLMEEKADGDEQGYRDGYAEAEPVKHGHWIRPYHSHYKQCSVCNRIHYAIPCNAEYCPFCGAKMDGGDL